MSKGSWNRVRDKKKYDENFKEINFPNKSWEDHIKKVGALCSAKDAKKKDKSTT